jgi:hypothetical protein
VKHGHACLTGRFCRCKASIPRLVRVGGSVVRGRLARGFEEDRTVAPLRNPDAQACMRASSSYSAADCTWPNLDSVGHSEHCVPLRSAARRVATALRALPRSGTTCKICLKLCWHDADTTTISGRRISLQNVTCKSLNTGVVTYVLPARLGTFTWGTCKRHANAGSRLA